MSGALVLGVGDEVDELLEGIGCQQTLADIDAAHGDGEGIEQALGLNVAGLLYRPHHVRGRLLAKTFHRGNLAYVAAQQVDIGKLANPSHVDEAGQRLLGDAVDVHALLRDEAREFLQLLGRTVGIGAMQGARAAVLAHLDGGGSTADGAGLWNLQSAFGADDLHHLRNNLVGLDHLHQRALAANAQPLALADVAERGALHGGSLQLHGLEHSHRRDG